MSTIRNLCTRCIVLEKGRIIFDGDVEKAISIYMDSCSGDLLTEYDFGNTKRHSPILGISTKIEHVSFINKGTASFLDNENIRLGVDWAVYQAVSNVEFTINVEYIDGTPVGFSEVKESLGNYEPGEKKSQITLDFGNLANGVYCLNLHISRINDDASINDLDEVDRILFEIVDNRASVVWQRQYWGSIHLNHAEFEMLS